MRVQPKRACKAIWKGAKQELEKCKRILRPRTRRQPTLSLIRVASKLPLAAEANQGPERILRIRIRLRATRQRTLSVMRMASKLPLEAEKVATKVKKELKGDKAAGSGPGSNITPAQLANEAPLVLNNNTQKPVKTRRSSTPDPRLRVGMYITPTVRITSILSLATKQEGRTIYIAHDTSTGTPRAVKVVARNERSLAHLTGTEGAIHKRISRTNHPHIVKVWDVVKTEEREELLIMDYCPEGDLLDVVDSTAAEQRSSKEYQAVVKRLFLQLVDAVLFCHSRNIIHGDLKPENVLVCDGWRTAKLADFGLAAIAPTDVILGTAPYIAPEFVAAGADGTCGKMDGVKNDVWALGVILVILFAGKPLWDSADVGDQRYARFLKDPVRRLRSKLNATPELVYILVEMLRPEPRHRASLPDVKRWIQHLDRFVEE